ncbi:hypothetical protein H8959_004741 [Pygathrix nigripes]
MNRTTQAGSYEGFDQSQSHKAWFHHSLEFPGSATSLLFPLQSSGHIRLLLQRLQGPCSAHDAQRTALSAQALPLLVISLSEPILPPLPGAA